MPRFVRVTVSGTPTLASIRFGVKRKSSSTISAEPEDPPDWLWHPAAASATITTISATPKGLRLAIGVISAILLAC